MDIEIIAKTRRISMKVLVTGVSGQLGHDVMNELAKRGYTGVGSDIAEKYSGADDGTAVVNMEYVQMDITDEKAVEDIITEVNPDVIVHCAAWTAVDMAEDDEFWIRGKDDLGNEYVFDLTSYEKPNLIFELENLEIPNHAKQLTLQLYHFSGTAGEIVSYEQKESEDAYIEEIGTVYGENQAPEDLAVPVGESITVDLQK